MTPRFPRSSPTVPFAPVALGALLLFASSALFPPEADAQQRDYRIRGEVIDASAGRPLSGVSVQVRGTRYGALSGDDGSYVIEATLEPGSYTLEFRLIGRKRATRQIPLGSTADVSVERVSLEATAVELQDIVVTGTGAPVERLAVGNTVATITGDEVNAAAGADAIAEALQGRLNGAAVNLTTGQAGGGVSVRLRGTSSILGGAEPLYVIDGVIVDNSSSALVSLSANAGRGGAALSNSVSDLVVGDIERIEVLKGAAAAALYGSRANNGVIQVFTKEGGGGEPRLTIESSAFMSQTPARYDLNDHPRAGLADVIWGGADSIGAPVQRLNLQDRLWRKGLSYKTKASISGGSGTTSYYLGGSWSDEEGTLVSNDAQNLSLRAKLSQAVGDILHVSAGATFVDADRSWVPTGEQVEGTLTNVIFTSTAWDFRFDENLGRYPHSPILGANPLDVVNNWEAPQGKTQFIGSLQATLRPTEALSLRYVAGLDDYRQEQRYFQPPQSMSPSFTGSVQNPVRLSRQFNNRLTATHVADLGASLGLESTAGFRFTQDRGEVVRAGARDLPPGQNLVSGATQFASQGISKFRTLGGFLQERLSIRDRLYLTAGLNAEASSAFGQEERLQYFPRGSLSWLLHEEPFWREGGLGDLFSTFRIRAAYGETGGQPPGIYSRFNNYADVNYAGRAGLVASSQAGNPDLKPERQKEWEAGLEAGLFDDRAVLELSYYDQTTEDLVLPIDLPPSRGVQTRFENIGELTNRGVEAALTTVNVDGENVSWRTRISLSANRNEVTNLVTASDTIFGGYLNIVAEGQPVGMFYGWYYERDAQGNIVIDENTGLGKRARGPNDTPLKKVLGNPEPDFIASLSNTVRVGDRLTLDVLFDGRFGNDVANFTRRITEFFGTDEVVEKEIERAIARKSNPDLQPLKYTLNVARILNYEEYIEDATYVKLRELSLRYDLGSAAAGLLGARGASLRVAGRNLVTWTDYSGLDPEINMFGFHTIARGVDFATVPVPRTFVASLSLNF